VKALAVDSLQNTIYMAVRQFPADPGSTTTGQPGVLAYVDPATTQPPTAVIQAVLSPLASASSQGTVRTRLVGRRVHVDGIPTGVSGTSALISITTTVGNESVPCGVDGASKRAFCNGYLIGDPLVGGTVTLAVDGVPVSRGLIVVPGGA
jgi:hypothetical protein